MTELLVTAEDRKALFDAGDHHPDQCDCTPFADEVDYLPQGTEVCQGFEDTLSVVEVIVRREVAKALSATATAWQWGEWANAPRLADRVQERIAAAQHVTDWLRARAEAASDG